MSNWRQTLNRVYTGACYSAWVINIGLLIFASIGDHYELQLLSIVNMILLSFVLLREPNVEKE